MSAGPQPATVEQLTTPALLVDIAVLHDNVHRMAAHARTAGVKLRPHAKTHKSPEIARLQGAAGAAGFTVATLREAEALAAAGFDDLLVAFPLAGVRDDRRVAALLERTRVTFLLDSHETAAAVGRHAVAAGAPLRCLWEVDCGARRTGTAPGEASARAATEAAARIPGIELAGFLTFPGHAYAAPDLAGLDAVVAQEREALARTAEAAEAAGLAVETLSGGTTPTAWRAVPDGPQTELRPGNYVFHDATQVALGVATVAQCALRVLATVVARPTARRVVVDAGSKALGREAMTTRTRGYALALHGDGLPVTALYEEHGVIEADRDVADLRVGDRVEIVPNHACVTANLHDVYAFRRGAELVDELPVEARGWAVDASCVTRNDQSGRCDSIDDLHVGA